MFKVNFFLKVFISLIFAFLISRFFVSKIIFPYAPIVRPSFRKALYTTMANFKKKVASAPQILLSLKDLPRRLLHPKISPFPRLAKPPLPSPTPWAYRPPRQPPPPTSPPLSPRPTATSVPPYSSPSPTPRPLATVTPIPPYNLTNLEQRVVNRVNHYRQEASLPTLATNLQLVFASRRHSKDLYDNNRCGHRGTDGSTPESRARDSGFTGTFYGETGGCLFDDPEEMVDTWWRYPEQHDILAQPEANQIGVGWWPLGSLQQARQTALVGKKP